MNKIATAVFLLVTAILSSAALAQQAGDPGPPDGAGPPSGVPELGVRNPAWFRPPSFILSLTPENAGPPGFVRLLHCACDESGDGMRYVEIMVTTRSRGHLQHVSGSVDSCAPEGSDLFLDFVLDMSDCQLEGDLIGDAIAPCSGQEAGQACGVPNGDEE